MLDWLVLQASVNHSGYGDAKGTVMTAVQNLRRFGLAMAMAGTMGLGATAAGAQTAPVLVELYTSQGCVSCPPADAFFSELKDQPGVIALALHVDYWDYLGWNDIFAKPEFTDRQKRYAKAVKAKMIYTPQMIISGGERLEGTRPEMVLEHIAQTQAKALPVKLDVARRGGEVDISAQALEALERGALVQVVRYLPSQTVAIERGENAGQEITYHNVVTSWQVLGEWDGAERLDLTAYVEGSDPVVVILQEPGPGPVLAVAEVK